MYSNWVPRRASGVSAERSAVQIDEGPVLGLVGEEMVGVHLGVHGGEQVEQALMHAL